MPVLPFDIPTTPAPRSPPRPSPEVKLALHTLINDLQVLAYAAPSTILALARYTQALTRRFRPHRDR